MPELSIAWNKFTVHKKHDIDRDRPYLWVYGIVIDAKTLQTRDYVTRHPSGSRNLGGQKFGKGDTSAVPSSLDVSTDVLPLAGTWAGGVAVVAWENATTRDAVIADAYEAGADAINAAIGKRLLTSADPLAEPTDEEKAAMGAAVEAEVRKVVKAGWTVFQLVPDHVIGHQTIVRTFDDGTETVDLDLRFKSGSTDYELDGTMRYLAEPPRPVADPAPPSKGLQSPKPQSLRDRH